MAHMTLPASHSDADARLAERIGRALELDEIHVFWTLPAAPADEATATGSPPPQPAAKRADLPAGLIGALSALGDAFERLGARLVARC